MKQRLQKLQKQPCWGGSRLKLSRISWSSAETVHNTAANVDTNNDLSNSLQSAAASHSTPLAFIAPASAQEGSFFFFLEGNGGIHREWTPIVQIFEVGKMDERDFRVSLWSHGLKFPHFSRTSQGNGRRSEWPSLSTHCVAFSSAKIPIGLNAGGHRWQIFVFLWTTNVSHLPLFSPVEPSCSLQTLNAHQPRPLRTTNAPQTSSHPPPGLPLFYPAVPFHFRNWLSNLTH